MLNKQQNNVKKIQSTKHTKQNKIKIQNRQKASLGQKRITFNAKLLLTWPNTQKYFSFTSKQLTTNQIKKNTKKR
jgi:hypothetical protein